MEDNNLKNDTDSNDESVGCSRLLGVINKWESKRDEDWRSGDYHRQCLGSRTASILKDFMPLLTVTTASGNDEVPETNDAGSSEGSIPPAAPNKPNAKADSSAVAD